MKTRTSSSFARRVSLANLIAQSLIILTGAIVRLTGSGLGCPTWPNCAPGSLIPVAEQVEGFHKYIEFHHLFNLQNLYFLNNIFSHNLINF
jgi:cytochrome c oxidase assembly protein subunit 15